MENLSKEKLAAPSRFEAVVIGTSAGGLKAMQILLPLIPAGFALPIIVVQHLHRLQDGAYMEALGKYSIPVREAGEKEPVEPGIVYFAPPDYHLLIELDRTFSLSKDEKVNFSRPSIDVLFETAADAYGPGLIGIVLTGANRDGALGLRRIKEKGGYAIVQDPATAQFQAMPAAAMALTQVDRVLAIDEIGRFLAQIGQ